MSLSKIEEVIEDASKGKIFILVDDEDRENEGDLCVLGEHASPEAINFMAKYGRGLICLSLTRIQSEKLGLSLMERRNEGRFETAFTVSIEASDGVTTGISAGDRSLTIKTAIKTNVKKKDIVSPGHIFPIISKDGGVLVRAGHTEASVDISKLAKKNPSAVICEIMNDKGVMTKGKELFEFANKHKLAIAKIEDLISYRLKNEKLVKLKKTDKIVIKNKKYQIKIFENQLDGSEHFALIKGKISPSKNTRVRVISSNLVESYLLGKRLPNSFNNTLDYFKDYNNCILVFIRDSNLKSVSSTLRDFKSNRKNKTGTDKLIRNYGIGAQIIKALRVKNMILVTRSPKKVIGLEGFGIRITKQEIIK